MCGIEQLQVVCPHHLDIPDRAGVVQDHQEILEELKVLLEFLLESTAKSGLRPFHSCLLGRFRVPGWAGNPS
jgi:hypothetical protein